MQRRVLLVDDDPFAQDLVQAILLSAGFKTDIAADGFQALKLQREHDYRIALIDYHLPEMDGYALAKLMTDLAQSRGSQLKLVAMTADRHGLAARRGSDALFSRIMVKPFEPRLLIDLVRATFVDGFEWAEEIKDAAAALLVEPNTDTARKAAAAFWRARNIERLPRAFVLPAPTSAESADLGMCFDLAGKESADLLILMNERGLEELAKLRSGGTSRVPLVVTTKESLLPMADVYFCISNPASWSNIAELLISQSKKVLPGNSWVIKF